MARKKKRSKGKKGGFKYKSRSKESWEKRAEQSGYSRRSMFKEGVTIFRPKDGDNLIRIFPPTFEDAEHYGLEIFVHYGIGPDRDSFLCPNKMLNQPCPVCEERSRAMNDDDKEYADKLNPKKRVLTYVLDRDEEEKGNQLWSMPWTLDADITTLAVDKRTGEVLDVDDPEDGYDVEFMKRGKGRNTEYAGVAIARRKSELGDEDALEAVVEMPLDETLVYFEYDDIAQVFGGSAPDREEEEEDDEDDDDEIPRRKKKKKKKAKKEKRKPNWGQVHEMDIDELEELIEEHDLDIEVDIDEDDDDELEDLRGEICEELDIEKPKKRKAKKKEKDKIRKRGRRR